MKRQGRGEACLDSHNAGEEQGCDEMHCSTAMRQAVSGKPILIKVETDRSVMSSLALVRRR